MEPRTHLRAGPAYAGPGSADVTHWAVQLYLSPACPLPVKCSDILRQAADEIEELFPSASTLKPPRQHHGPILGDVDDVVKHWLMDADDDDEVATKLELIHTAITEGTQHRKPKGDDSDDATPAPS